MKFRIITFYQFKQLDSLEAIKLSLLELMDRHSVYGTIILAQEGFNSTVCGGAEDIDLFVRDVEKILKTRLELKSSYSENPVFKRQKVRIKDEIVTLRKTVDVSLGEGTHVTSKEWNKLIVDPDTVVLDARNDYEYKIGTFKGAVNPETESFNELPEFVEKNFDPERHKKIAMFCTGGIRCEKFAPYMKSLGFKEVYQLDGGILRYLEETNGVESQWEGECFVFDERVSVDPELNEGKAADYSVPTKPSTP